MDENSHTTVMEQVEAVRRSSLTNMFQQSQIQKIASDCGFHELVVFIEENDPGMVIEMQQEAVEMFEGEELSVPIPERVRVEKEFTV